MSLVLESKLTDNTRNYNRHLNNLASQWYIIHYIDTWWKCNFFIHRSNYSTFDMILITWTRFMHQRLDLILLSYNLQLIDSSRNISCISILKVVDFIIFYTYVNVLKIFADVWHIFIIIISNWNWIILKPFNSIIRLDNFWRINTFLIYVFFWRTWNYLQMR